MSQASVVIKGNAGGQLALGDQIADLNGENAILPWLLIKLFKGLGYHDAHFESYSRKDSRTADDIIACLNSDGFNV